MDPALPGVKSGLFLVRDTETERATPTVVAVPDDDDAADAFAAKRAEGDGEDVFCRRALLGLLMSVTGEAVAMISAGGEVGSRTDGCERRASFLVILDGARLGRISHSGSFSIGSVGLNAGELVGLTLSSSPPWRDSKLFRLEAIDVLVNGVTAS